MHGLYSSNVRIEETSSQGSSVGRERCSRHSRTVSFSRAACCR